LPWVSRHDRLQDAVPRTGTVNVAGTKGAAFQIAELIEHEERMVAGAFIVAVPDTLLLLAVSRAHTRIHVEDDASRRPAAMNPINPLARQLGESG
jgi:hypothetical protein